MNDVFNEFDALIETKVSTPIEFDFESCELTEPELASISIQIKKFFSSFRKYKNNSYEICEALSEIEKILKPSGKFMEWYESVGLSKDMVSVFLKRWSLYMTYQKEYKDRIFSLSDQAIKILTNKDAEYDEVKAILDGDYLKVKEIKSIMLPKIEKTKREFLPMGQKFFNPNKIKKMNKRVNSLSEEDKKIYKEELKNYIQKLVEFQEQL